MDILSTLLVPYLFFALFLNPGMFAMFLTFGRFPLIGNDQPTIFHKFTRWYDSRPSYQKILIFLWFVSTSLPGVLIGGGLLMLDTIFNSPSRR